MVALFHMSLEDIKVSKINPLLLICTYTGRGRLAASPVYAYSYCRIVNMYIRTRLALGTYWDSNTVYSYYYCKGTKDIRIVRYL